MGTLIYRTAVGFLVAFACFLFMTADASAEVYYHKKVDGKHVYTNLRPSDKGYKKIYTSTPSRIQPKYYGRSTSYSKNYDDLITYYSDIYDLDPMLVKAIIKVESNFNSGAVSSKGAVGLMQLMPGTASDMGVRNSLSPTQNIGGGTRYLRRLMDMFNEDLDLSLAGYNAGENAVIKYGWNIPPYPETQNYVQKVRYHYTNLKNDPANKPKVRKQVIAAKPESKSFSYREQLEEVGSKFEPKPANNKKITLDTVEYKTVATNIDYRYSLQVASYPSYQTAVENLRSIRTKAGHAYMQEASIPGKGTYYRIKVGKFSTKDSALVFAQNFKSNHPQYNTAFVTDY